MKQELPQAVKGTIERLRTQHVGVVGYIELKVIKGNFCIYESTSKWDKKTKKPIKVQKYLGRILKDGTLVHAKHRQLPAKDNNADLDKKSNKVTTAQTIRPTGTYEADSGEVRLLRYLSMNARMPLLQLAKSLKFSRGVVYNRVKGLREKYKIKYIPEIDVEKLGYTKYLLFVKFKEIIPPQETLKKALGTEPRMQLALLTKGEYDVLGYMIAEDNVKATDAMYSLRFNTELVGFKSEWNLVPFDETYGTVQLRDEFFGLLKDRIWHRTKVDAKPGQGRLTESKYKVLRELNKDGSASFSEIDKACGFKPGSSSQYMFKRLKEDGIIKRMTINIRELPMHHLGVIIHNVVDGEAFSNTRINYLRHIIRDKESVINSYALIGDVGALGSFVAFLPVFRTGELEAIEDELRNEVKGITIKSLIVSAPLLGLICFRNFDNAHSRQHGLLAYKYRIKEYDTAKTNYG
jgi:DNA-binding Lrp family transcriptional regulator